MENWNDLDPIPEAERLAYWREKFPSGCFWCLNCQMGFNLEDHRKLQMAKAKAGNVCECVAYMAVDGIDWGDFRVDHPDYPEIPEKGVVYLLYPEDGSL